VRDAFTWNGKIVLIGASTGGVEALETVLSAFPPNGPPVVIVQHMPTHFLRSFARRLNRMVPPDVGVARDGSRLCQGRIVLAPGHDRHLVLDIGPPAACRLVDAAKVSGHRPSADMLFASAVGVAQNVVAALLTGMGRDGAEGMRALRSAGALTLVQDQSSCTIYGMPRAAKQIGGVCRELPLAQIADALLEATGTARPGTAARPPGAGESR